MATSDEKKLKTTEETNQDRVQGQPQEPAAAPQPNEQGNDQSRQQNQEQADPNDPTVNDGSPGREQPTQPKEGVGGDHISND
jgi:hypothetical protein